MKGCLRKPTTVHDLIRQCMVMTHALSGFRLAFLDGQGRHFAVMHSLLGVDPKQHFLPLLPDPVKSVPDFDPSIVSQFRGNVDLMDTLAERMSFPATGVVMRAISSHIQTLAQTILASDVSNFMLRWCDNLERTKDDWLQHNEWEEVDVDKDEQIGPKSEWYQADKFKQKSLNIINEAIEYIEKEITDATDEEHPLRVILRKLWQLAKVKDEQPDANWNKVVAWFKTKIADNFNSGYLTRSANLQLESLAGLIFLMTHCLCWKNPDMESISRPLKLFLQAGGSGTREWVLSTHFFPNPYPTRNEVTPTFALDDDVSCF